MTSRADHQWTPPPPRPKQRNVYFGIYDAPVYRDWCAWLTVSCAVITFAAISTSTEPRQIPVWLDVPLATIVLTFIFGVLPSFLRRQIRRLLWRRRCANQTQAEPMVINGSDRSGQDPNVRIDVAKQDAIAKRPAVGFYPVPMSIPQESKAGDRSPIRPLRSMTAVHKTTDESLTASVELRESRQLQFPVARAVRALQLATDSKDQYEALLDVADALSVTLGTTASAWMRSLGAGQEALDSLREAYLARGVSQGSWHQMLSQAIRLDVDGGFPSGFCIASNRTKRGNLLTHLGALVQERNRWAHGSRPRNSAEAARRVVELQQILEAALSGSVFLAEMPWVLTRSSSYQPRSREFHVIAFRVMGDHPEFERQDLTSAVPLADESIYLLDQQNPIDLSPFLVMRYCDTCRKRQICYADRLDTKRGTALKSFECGHGMFDPGLDDEVRALRESR
ncbi:MAG: hypothetical protein ACRDTG_06130 [Pseudonocardiaceae bacterium]